MMSKIEELKQERAKLQVQLANVKAVLEKFKDEPQEYSYELAKAAKDAKFYEDRIKEMDKEVDTLSKTDREREENGVESVDALPTREGTVVRSPASEDNLQSRAIRS